MRIKDLKPSIFDMDEQQLREHIRGIRTDRRISKGNPKQKAKVQKERASTRDKTEAQFKAMLSSMTEAERDALWKELEKNV